MRTPIVITAIFGSTFKTLYPAPLPVSRCFVFSNQRSLRQECLLKGWRFVFVDDSRASGRGSWQTSSCPLLFSSLQSKWVKFLSLTEDFPAIFKDERYVLYCDHKFKVMKHHVDNLMSLENPGVIIRHTPLPKLTIDDEFEAAENQERYREKMLALRSWSANKIKDGYSEKVRICNTGLMLYDLHISPIRELCKKVYESTIETENPECQILWAILSQKYTKYIKSIDFYKFPMYWAEPQLNKNLLEWWREAHRRHRKVRKRNYTPNHPLKNKKVALPRCPPVWNGGADYLQDFACRVTKAKLALPNEPHWANRKADQIEGNPSPRLKVDVVMLTYTESQEIRDLTHTCIHTLSQSETDIDFNIYLIETDKTGAYPHDYFNVTTIVPDAPFHYNKFLNIGLQHCTSDWVIISNNDVTYTKGWFTHLQTEYHKDNTLLSMSPLTKKWPFHEKFEKVAMADGTPAPNVYYGYKVAHHLTGWCLVIHQAVLSKLGPFDERFSFWYQDNDYAMELQKK